MHGFRTTFTLCILTNAKGVWFIHDRTCRGPSLTLEAKRARVGDSRPVQSPLMDTRYITTPIYYVNDRPHIGHCYTTLMADVTARFHRLILGGGDRVFFLTGTDEHADKVVTAANQRGLRPIDWADQNAARFRDAFDVIESSHDDFIRTSEDRHKSRVTEYLRRLMVSGDVVLGDYTGWYDEGQEEYLTETTAKDNNFLSPVTKQPLVRRTEKNYFFRLSAYADRLLAHIQAHPEFIQPEARRNEVLGRLRTGLQDIPVSRAVAGDPGDVFGVLMPDAPGHRVYVWIDALFNYLTAVDTPDRRRYWPATVHLMAKDILWFHAVIWPCLLMALGEPLPKTVYAHSYWIREGMKMSKSLGNFIEIETLRAYADRYSVDAVRWYLVTQGPMGATDADFSHAKFIEVYNADLANGIGNCASRVATMIGKYFDGRIPPPGGTSDLGAEADKAVSDVIAAIERVDMTSAAVRAIRFVSEVDGLINRTEPFRMAKDPKNLPRVGEILYDCAEAVRVAAILLTPVMPLKMAGLLESWSCAAVESGRTKHGASLQAASTSGAVSQATSARVSAPLAVLAQFRGPHALAPGQVITRGQGLFQRADTTESPPA